MGSRRAARELALQYLFGHEFQVQGAENSQNPQSSQSAQSAQSKEAARHKMTPKQWFHQYAEDFQVESETADFSCALCEGVLAHKNEIDPVIQSHSAHWKISRMSLVDINILRVAVFEMHFSQNPLAPKIVINEAIDIAKLYGTIDSGSFVNGIIDQIAKSLSRS